MMSSYIHWVNNYFSVIFSSFLEVRNGSQWHLDMDTIVFIQVKTQSMVMVEVKDLLINLAVAIISRCIGVSNLMLYTPNVLHTVFTYGLYSSIKLERNLSEHFLEKKKTKIKYMAFTTFPKHCHYCLLHILA